MSEKYTLSVWNTNGTPKTGASVALVGAGTYSGTELGVSGKYYWASIPLGKYFLRVNGVDTGESFAVGDGEELKLYGGDVFGSVQVETALKIYYDVLNPFSGNGAIDTFAGVDSASVYLTANSLSFDKRIELYVDENISTQNVRNGSGNEARKYVSAGLVDFVLDRDIGDSRFEAILSDDTGVPYARLFLGVTNAYLQVNAKGNLVELSHYDGVATDTILLPVVTGATKTLATNLDFETPILGLTSANQITTNGYTYGYAPYTQWGATAGTTTYASRVTGDASIRHLIKADGTQEWGDGSTRDTNLYRASANLLKTDDSFQVVGQVKTNASTTTQAGVNLPHGVDPTIPVNGDLWTKTTGLFTRINGVTEQATFSAYGEIHVHDSAVAQSIPTGATYTLITNWTDNGLSLYTTPDALTSRRITVSKTGVYEVSYNCSMLLGTSNVVLFISAFKNGTTELDNLHFSRKIGTGSDVGSASFNGIIQLSAGDYIDVRIKHDNVGSVNFTQVYANLNLKRV